MSTKILLIILLSTLVCSCSSTKPNGIDLYNQFCLGYDEEYLSKRQNILLISQYSDAIKSHPDDAHNYACRGLSNLYNEDFSAAEADLTSAIELYKGAELRSTLLFIRGLTYDRLLKNKLAIADYEESFHLASWEGRHYSIITYCLAMAYLNEGNISKAKEYSNLAVKWQKYNDYPHYIRSLVNIEQLDYSSALSDASAAIEYSVDKRHYTQYNYLLSQNPKALYLTHRAFIYGELGRPLAANQDLKDAFERGVKDQDVLINVARVLAISSSAKVRDSSLAIQIANKSLTMSAKPPFAAIEALAHAFADRGQFAKAAQLMDDALNDDAHISVLWRQRAELARAAFKQNLLLYPVHL